MSFLYFLEGLRNPVCDTFFSTITYLGDETLFLVIALFIYWCIDKFTGYYIMATGFTGTLTNQFMKLLCRIPRPWVIDPDFTIVESARAGATGYSFPSGHTQISVSTYGIIALEARRKWIRAVCIALVILVPFSRMYLGVHTPLDVSVAFGTALVLMLIYYPVIGFFRKNPNKMNYLFWFITLLSLAYLMFVELYKFPADIDAANLASGVKNAYTLLGCMLGICISYPIDQKYIKFETKAPLPAQIIKLVLGIGIVVALRAALKVIFSAIFGEDFMLANTIRYMLMVIFAAVVWPMTFSFWAKLFSKKGKKNNA